MSQQLTNQPERGFTVGLTADFYNERSEPRYRDLGLSELAQEPAISHRVLDGLQKPIGAGQLKGVNAVIVLTPPVSAESVAAADDLLVVARFGVGYDTVDVAACTKADVLVTITTGAVDRPVAEAVVGWMICLTHHVLIKDRLVRQGEWDRRSGFMGRELRDRTLGIVGLGGIGRELIRLLGTFGMKPPLAYDPMVDPAVARAAGVELVDLPTLLRRSDFVSLHCPLTAQTRGLIGREQLALMRPDSYLINTARGGIVDEDALYQALTERRIAGAAIDCFETEPVGVGHRFAGLDNVLLAPHSIAWTDELFRDIGRTACRGIVDLYQGRRPRGVINPDVFDRPGFRTKYERVTDRPFL
jgi:phosphoglycerate dehydrogenase-like enzyme